MNFYFQSGEFLGDDGSSFLDLFVQFLGIVVGAGISILVFQLGKHYDRQKEAKRISELEKYLQSAVDNLHVPLKLQIESLEKFSQQLAGKRDVDYAPQAIVSLHSRTIRWISHNDLYSIFVNQKEGLKALQTFNSDLDYIDAVSSTLQQLMNLFMTNKDKFVEEYNSSVKNISRKKDEMSIEYNMQNSKIITINMTFFIN